MVRTVLCHPFSEQKGFTDQYNASCICCTADDRVIVASLYGSINIIDLRSTTNHVLHKFPSTGVPVKMLFCDNQQFLLSMESKLQDYRAGLSAREMHCQARVYVNIMLGNPQKNVTPLNSGYTTNRHSNIFQTRNKFAIIDLSSLRQPATDIALCSVRNNIAIASSKKIYLYFYKEVISEELPDDDNIATIDFIRTVEVQTTISIRSVALVLNCVAFASKTEIRAIKVYLHQPSDQKVYQGEDVSELLDESSDQITTNEQTASKSTIATQTETTVWNFERASSISDFESKIEDGMMHMQSIQEEKPFIDSMKNSKETIGEHASIVGHPLYCSFLGQIPSEKGHLYYANVTCNTHLYRRFHEDEISFSGETEKIHSLQWMPIFLEGLPEHQRTENNDTSKTTWPWNSFQKPTDFPSMTSLLLFFSTGTNGYLYNMQKPETLVLSYNYTSDCISAVHTDSLLYTITDNGMEIFTSRIYPFISEKTKELCTELCEVGEDKTNKASKSRKQYRSRERGDTEMFLETNYFTDYVSVNKDLSMTDDETLQFQLRKRTTSSYHDKYPFSILNMPCPSKEIETCLVGMHPYQDVVAVTTSTSFIIMFIKPKRRMSISSTTSQNSPWSLCSFEKHSAIDFSEKIHKLIDGNEFNNPTVYYQLLCESHFLLCGDLLTSPLDEKLVERVKKSAVDIATFLTRCDTEMSDFKLIRNYFEMAGMSIPLVLAHLKSLNAHLESKKYKYGAGVIEYLNTILFNPNSSISTLEKEFCDFIINVYAKNSPSDLSKIIMKSYLPQNYTFDLCVKLLSKYKRKKETNESSIQPLDYLCFAYLHMNLGNPGHAEELLKDVKEEELIKLFVSNEEVLMNKQCQLTHMGQLLKKYFKETFQSILVSLYDAGSITLENILSFFKQHDEDDNTLKYSYHACLVLETLLNDSSRRKKFFDIVILLIDQYLIRLQQRKTTEGWKLKHDHEIKGNGHFSSRLSWLNSLKPFSGDLPGPQDCVLAMKNNQRKRSEENILERQEVAASLPNDDFTRSSSPLNNLSSSTKEHNGKSLICKKHEFACPCCCCSDILMKFQSLLCSRFNRKDLCLFVIEKLKPLSFVGKESLLLLCWPKAGLADKAIKLIVNEFPSLILQYAKDMFDWKAQWQQLLEYILNLIKKNSQENWNQDVYVEALKGVLLRLARVYTPKEFLDMLPPDASVNFMLPYLRECCEFHNSASLKKQILMTM